MELMYLLDSFHWTNLLQPQWYVENGGLWLLLFVVFAETGLFVQKRTGDVGFEGFSPQTQSVDQRH